MLIWRGTTNRTHGTTSHIGPHLIPNPSAKMTMFKNSASAAPITAQGVLHTRARAECVCVCV